MTTKSTEITKRDLSFEVFVLSVFFVVFSFKALQSEFADLEFIGAEVDQQAMFSS